MEAGAAGVLKDLSLSVLVEVAYSAEGLDDVTRISVTLRSLAAGTAAGSGFCEFARIVFGESIGGATDDPRLGRPMIPAVDVPFAKFGTGL